MHDDDEVWVQVEALKGQVVAIYRGRMSRAHLQAWCAGELRRGAATLRQTYWVEEDPAGRSVPVVVGRDGRFRQCSGVIHLSGRTLVSVMELRGPDPGVEIEAEVLQLASRE